MKIEYFLICYLFYMFIVFKTKYSFNHPFEYLLNNNNNISNFFKHPIGNSNVKESKICPFGKKAIYLLLIYLFIKTQTNIPKKIRKIILITTFTISLMNFNAVIYLVPYFIYEYKQIR